MVKINLKNLEKEFKNNYKDIGNLWILHQCRWLINLFKNIKDQTKLEISIFLLYHFLKYNNDDTSYENLISMEKLEIVNLKLSHIHKLINLPKERVRRKLNELCKSNLIENNNSKIILKKEFIEKLKLSNQSNEFSKYFSKLLKQIKIDNIKPDLVQANINKNFSYFLTYFYKFQLFFLDVHKKSLNNSKLSNLKVMLIFGSIMLAQILNNKKFKSEDTTDFLKINLKIFNRQNVIGISASSISDITYLPRPTVTRICKFLLKNKILKINKSKHYHISNEAVKLFTNNQKKVFKEKYIFLINVLKLINNKELV
jgi:hypothetical protein